MFGGVPEVGQIIARAHERVALRVTDVRDIHRANWDLQTLAAWRAAGEPPWETWTGRERGIHGRPAADPKAKERGFVLFPWGYGEQYVLLTDPYPVCVECGLVWPCWCHETNQEATKASAELDRLAAIKPGECWACGEYIRPRQQRIVFEGDNLLLPGAPPPVFHTAALRVGRTWTTCFDEARAYERRWIAAAAPGEHRPYRVACPGLLRTHLAAASGAECTYDCCPGARSWHQDSYNCLAQVYAPGGKVQGASWAAVGAPVGRHEMLPTRACEHPGCRGRMAVTL